MTTDTYGQRWKSSAGTLVSGSIKFVRIFPQVTYRKDRQWDGRFTLGIFGLFGSKIRYVWHFSARIYGVFPVDYIAYVTAPRGEDPKLIIHVISFELVQPIRPRYINVTVGGQTDGQTDR